MIQQDSYNLISLQHELIMSIGSFNDSEEIIRKFSLRAIKTLNLKRIHIIQNENLSLAIEERVFSIPPTTLDLFEQKKKLAKFYNTVTPDETNFIEEIQCSNGFMYCYAVKDLGYILFERRVKPFDDSLIHALIAPITRFSMAYLNKQQFLLNIKQKDQIKEISSELEQDKLQFETILEAINDAVIAINTKKEIFFANKSAHKFLELDSDMESSGKKYYEFFRLFCLENNEDITRRLELKMVQDENQYEDHPLLLKAPGSKPIICEINAQEIRDTRKNDKNKEVYFVFTFHDITENYEMEKVLSWQASHDALTECLNRSGFDNQFHTEIENNESDHHALICLDLDRFKHVNDIGGHQAGDNLLKQVTGLIQNEIKDTDVLGRVGGDEFCIFAKNCTMEYATELSERILETIKRLRFPWEDNVFSIGVSIGVTEIRPQDTDYTVIFFRADEACMRSKQNGRNQVTQAHDFSDKLHSATSKINYISYINKSLSTEESDFNFMLYQQQIKAITPSERDHIEILLRIDYQGEIILPNAFLPTAERYGLVSTIDLWVVENALRYISQNDSSDVNVNLSGVTLSDDISMKKLYELLLSHPKEAKRLCMEVTETAIITNLSKCLKFMENAASLGVSFALDDFGTGLSSYGNLKNLPVEYLKIDGSFIRDICNNEIDQIVVKSINEAASAMNIKTVAEYVENQSILDKVSNIGIDFAQGFYLNEPEKLQLH